MILTRHPQDQTAAADAGGAFGENVGRTFRALWGLISRTGTQRSRQSERHELAGESAADATGLHEQVLYAVVHVSHHAVLAGDGAFDADQDLATAQ